jgi:hypothetical protein
MDQVRALKCPSCGSAIPDNSTTCRYCHTKVVLSNDGTRFILVGYICPRCGENNKEENNFCKKCGYDLVRKCLSCERRIPLDTIHCPFCGKSEEKQEIDRLERRIYLEKAKLKRYKASRDNKLVPIGCLLIIAFLGGSDVLAWLFVIIALAFFVAYCSNLRQKPMIETEIAKLEQQIYVLKMKDKEDRRSGKLPKL